MNLDRRKLLQLFTSGAIIAPVLDGSPILEATAKIVKPPEVDLELPEPLATPANWNDAQDWIGRRGPYRMRVYITDEQGRTHSIDADTFFSKVELAYGMEGIRWEMTGHFSHRQNGFSLKMTHERGV